jgi:hypothetical protein
MDSHFGNRRNRAGRVVLSAVASVLAITCTSSFAQTPPATDNSPTSPDHYDVLSGVGRDGKLLDLSVAIQTRLGELQVPADNVATIVSQPPPRIGQTITTHDGDILIGRLTATSLRIGTPDGSALVLPIGELSHLTHGTIAIPAINPPAAYSLRGDQLCVNPPPSIEFRTRWGVLTFQSSQVREIVFSSAAQAAHRIYLADGSVLNGILTTDPLTLAPRSWQQPALAVPVGELARLVISAAPPASGGAPRLDMAGGDVLRGALAGLTIQSDFGDNTVGGGEIDKITQSTESRGDLAITVAGGAALRGAPQEGLVAAHLACGVTVNIPPAMIVAYTRSAPASNGEEIQPAASTEGDVPDARVAALVNQLSNPNPAVQVNARNQLIGLGSGVAPALTRLRATLPPPIQARIDQVLRLIARANPSQP